MIAITESLTPGGTKMPIPPKPESLYRLDGLRELDARFRHWLRDCAPLLAQRLERARADIGTIDSVLESEIIVALAPELERFLGEIFGIEAEITKLRDSQARASILSDAQRHFVRNFALLRYAVKDILGSTCEDLRAELEAHLSGPLSDIVLSKHVLHWLQNQAKFASELTAAARYTVWAVGTPEGRVAHRDSVLFRSAGIPHSAAAVLVKEQSADGARWLSAHDTAGMRQRQGFTLSDPGCTLAAGVAEAKYCIYCHHQNRDSCAKGARNAEGAFLVNDSRVTRTGCPLGQKISEMHEIRARGHALAALAIICIDNPMVAGTGHRICNDCMVGCIYQNAGFEPVNVPQSETRILRDVLGLPWGFEVYSLLTRWNPLNLRRPLPLSPTGRSVLVAGLGPAGYTLAHHLLNDGHNVVAIDGLKIEPLPASLGGRFPGCEMALPPLIRDASQLMQPLDQRGAAGFGGVGEYGITVRWDKNFLTIIRLLLERRERFACYGGIRFGGSITMESASELGFDHVALCLGAGRPTVLDIPNGLARGVRTASDFLMGLQLTGAARAATLANLQLRLPVVVVGGGLTAIDTCTEAMAYYPVQVEKFLARFETLCDEMGESTVRSSWTAEERAIADEFLLHAQELRAERAAAARIGREARVRELIQSWGGARIVYRRRMVDSPAYRNPEELAKALEEGLVFGENLTPIGVETDKYGHACSLRVRSEASNEPLEIPARTILIAAGTSPNTVLATEDRRFVLDGRHFRALDEDGVEVTPERSTRPAVAHVITHFAEEGPSVSFFGDLHPSFSGTVVSAMASAKAGYPILSRILNRRSARTASFSDLRNRLDDEFNTVITEIETFGPSIVELCVRSPRAAREFKPGQFFRLQNFEAAAERVGQTVLAMESVAVTAAASDVERGLLWLVVLAMGGSTELVKRMRIGDRISLMGPTGEATVIPPNETVLLAGGGVGNAVLFSIGMALKEAGSRVLYFAGFRDSIHAFRQEHLQHASDEAVWCVDSGTPIEAGRPQDHSFVGNIVQAMVAYANGDLGRTHIRLQDVDRIIAIGSDRMMSAVHAARSGVLAPYLKNTHVAVASINSPMQCMMKGICGQCLQSQRDPVTGRNCTAFTCAQQDQDMAAVDFEALHERLAQNSLQEKLTRLWVARITRQAPPSA